MSLYFSLYHLVFRNFRPLKKTIPVKQEPSYEVLDGGKLIVIRMVVTCRSQPVLQWMHGTRSVAVIGRYKQEIVKEGDGYAIVLKIDQVGLISMMSSLLFPSMFNSNHTRLQRFTAERFFIQPKCTW